MRILLAEDGEANRQLAIRFLRRMGYECTTVVNGEEAVDAVRCGEFDLVLMDIHMPRMDGLAAARAICSEHGDRRPQIIAMTADALQDDRERCLAAGMDDYVSKPIRMSDLQRAISAAAARVDPNGHRDEARSSSSVASALPMLAIAAGDAVVFDPTALDETREILGADADSVVRDLFSSFQTRAPEMLAAMREAIGIGNLKELEDIAHTLKGWCGTIGARRMQVLSATLEEGARGHGSNDTQSLIARLEGELAVLLPELPAGSSYQSGSPSLRTSA